MPILTKPSSAPSTSLSYITIGAIMTILAGTSYFFFHWGETNSFLGYVRMSFLLLGIVFLVIGFTVGQIGRAARTAELPPSEATPVVAQEHLNTSARAGTQPVAQPPSVPPTNVYQA